MPRRHVTFLPGAYYHVYNRGANHQPIFFERENYLFFLQRVRKYLLGERTSNCKNSKVLETLEVCDAIPPVDVVAYCLMPNHYHLLLALHDVDLSHRMQLLAISYTKAINNRYERTGALFEGHFHATHIEDNDYLLQLSRYICLNPVLAGLVEQPEEWEFSSYRDMVGLRRGTLPRPSAVMSQFGTREKYREFVESYAPADRKRISHLLEE